MLPNLPDEAEVIFYDDASPDNSYQIIQHFQDTYSGSHIRLIRGQHNVGITQVRHLLLAASSADYIWFVDSDDLVATDAPARLLKILNRFTPDVVLFDYDVFYDDSGTLKSQESLSIAPSNTLLRNSGNLLYRIAILDGRHYFWNKVFRRALIHALPDLMIPAYEDITYTPMLLNQCETFYYLPVSLVHYRIWGQSIVQKMGLGQAYGIQAT
ncbi:glycosyltransferase [Snodgrassella sp. CFCC 13594]|uniref:glycosyltransferase family 2 protein n=1 Tax=Snodgrassella sp. CFCC 13594 TaxID=1775559 RepID=UPI000833090C|nr:glycosyltransferase [Snodgrassella sp. CFCC 13594]